MFVKIVKKLKNLIVVSDIEVILFSIIRKYWVTNAYHTIKANKIANLFFITREVIRKEKCIKVYPFQWHFKTSY